MSNIDICCIADFVDDKCHLESLRAKKTLYKINTISAENLEILKLRVTGLKEIEDKSICDYHYKRYISFYSSKEYKCCDPYSKHNKSVQSSLTDITLEFSKKVKKICNLSIVPGKKICSNCKKQFIAQFDDYEEQLKYCIDPFRRHRNKIDDQLFYLEQNFIDYLKDVCNLTYTSEHKICNVCIEKLFSDLDGSKNTVKNSLTKVCETITEADSSQTTNSTPSEFQTDSQKKRSLDDILNVLNIPPFKRQKLTDDRTVKEGVAILQSTVNTVTEAFEVANNVKLPKYENLTQMSFESTSFHKIILNMQDTYNASSTNKKISMLTLLPANWTLKEVNVYFNCSKHMFYEAKKLRGEKGTSIIHAYYIIIILD